MCTVTIQAYLQKIIELIYLFKCQRYFRFRINIKESKKIGKDLNVKVECVIDRRKSEINVPVKINNIVLI